MNMFKGFHPLTQLVYFLCVLLIPVFTLNPMYTVPSLSGGVLFFLVLSDGAQTLRHMLFSLITAAVIALLNPLFSHNGATVLFFINDSRITLEAFVYGLLTGISVINVITWFKCFNRVFDSERTLYIFGRHFPKLGLVLSMSLRFVPLLARTFKSINSSQKSLNSGQGRLRRYLSSFSAVITRAMEGAVITSDSMRARAYGESKRTCFSRFRFTAFDGVFTAAFAALFVASFVLLAVFGVRFGVYPRISVDLSAPAVFSACACAALAFFPFIFETEEGLRWKYSISKI